jgi:hypothetical protein
VHLPYACHIRERAAHIKQFEKNEDSSEVAVDMPSDMRILRLTATLVREYAQA